MTLSSAFAIINSSFASTAAQSSVIARNISNANTPGYTREIANQITNGYGGADVVSVTNEANRALLEQLNLSTSESGAQNAISTGVATLAQTVNDSASATSTSGALQNGGSPSAMLGNLQSALETYAASPTSAASGQAAATAAAQVAQSLNAGSTAVQHVRSEADSDISTSVATINSLLTRFASANGAVVAGLGAGADVNQAENSRNSLLTQIAGQIGISTTTGANGSMSIYTDSGVTLFQDAPRTLSFASQAVMTAGVAGNPVTVDGAPITGASAPMAIHSGALAGLAKLRDSIAPEYQAQLDQIAGGLVSAFAETDQSATPSGLALPGLFTFVGATGVPSSADIPGLASRIEINPHVDPSQGGDVTRLRDGAISNPGSAAYSYNATGAASYSGRLQQLSTRIDATQSFAAGAGLGSSSSLSGYANNSVSWLQAQNQRSSDAANYQTSVVAQAGAALSNATGVNLDTEMTNMLNIENSYTTSAKLLTTVNAMLSALINAA